MFDSSEQASYGNELQCTKINGNKMHAMWLIISKDKFAIACMKVHVHLLNVFSLVLTMLMGPR